MSFEDSSAKLDKHILGIKQLINNPDLSGLIKRTGEMGQQFIEMHNIEANYLGGDYATKGYSSTTLPLFFFGQFTLVERTGNIRLTNEELQVTNMLIRKEHIHWTTTKEGKRMAWLQGGYRTFLRHARPGKNLDKVDHQFSGDMLRALTHEIRFFENGAEVRWYVRSPQERKALWTHNKRNWMGLFREEIDQIKQMASREYALIIYDQLTFE